MLLPPCACSTDRLGRAVVHVHSLPALGCSDQPQTARQPAYAIALPHLTLHGVLQNQRQVSWEQHGWGEWTTKSYSPSQLFCFLYYHQRAQMQEPFYLPTTTAPTVPASQPLDRVCQHPRMPCHPSCEHLHWGKVCIVMKTLILFINLLQASFEALSTCSFMPQFPHLWYRQASTYLAGLNDEYT